MVAMIAWAVSGLCAVWCVLSVLRDPRRLRNGVLALLAVLSACGAVVSTRSPVAQAVVGVAAIPVALLAIVGYVSLALFLLVNGVIVMRREGRSPALMLPLCAGCGMVVVAALTVWAIVWGGRRPGIIPAVLGLCAVGVLTYFGFVFLSFVVYGMLYRLRTRSPGADVVLVLGSRIIDGRVPPLLAARLDRGIEVYRRREAEGLPLPVLICCGGQGADESCAEAHAMAGYLREKGIAEACVLEEDRSTTTWENLEFGSRIAAEVSPGASLLVATNDYHTFRTALLTRQLGLSARVVAARTARYYVPAAFLREFIAIVRDYLWVHAGMLGLFAAFVGLLVWESLQQS